MSEAIPSWARVGAKVVYIDDSPGDVDDGGKRLIVGEVYVLRAVTDEFPSVACRVVGDGLEPWEFMRLNRFRPLVSQSDDISVHFAHLLDTRAPELV